jgi:Nucleotide-binding protein implicated in inhibition of septum formation
MTALILASASGVRARLLREAGVRFGVRPPDIDESAVKSTLHAQGVGIGDMAGALAEAKALNVSAVSPHTLVLGCDQTLICGERLFDKARDTDEAREHLSFLRGKAHQLISACVLAKDGEPVWRYCESAILTMRSFSAAFLDSYIKTEGKDVLSAVGCYQLEGRGAQLFESVKGDYFTVLGLPLIPFLAALRERGLVPS